MTWRDFIDSEIKTLSENKKNDIQYKNLGAKNLHSLFFNEIAEWLELKKKIPFEKLLLLLNQDIKSSEKLLIHNFTLKRLSGMPKAYILGEVSFWNLKLKVSKHTLIPRPETEELAKITVKEIKKSKERIELIEIGAGSGCLGLSVLKNLKKNIPAVLSDIDSKAIALAKENALLNKIDQKKVKFIKSDLLDFIKKKDSFVHSSQKLFVLANLPYVSEKEYASLSPEVSLYEPRRALVGGKYGSELIKKLLDQVAQLIFKKNPAKKIVIFLEASPSTIPLITKYLRTKKNNPFSVEEINDLSEKKRFIKLKTGA